MPEKKIIRWVNENLLLIRCGKKNDLTIIDDVFPFPNSPWRNFEFLEYDRHFNVTVISDVQDKNRAIPTNMPFDDLLAEFNQLFPNSITTKRLSLFTQTNPSLVYLLFYNYLHRYFNAIKKKNYPLGFTLYPGGGFEINNHSVDQNLKSIGDYKNLRFVTVNQKFTYNYLTDKNLIPKEKIALIPGVPLPIHQIKKGEHIHSDTIRVAFVSNKYTAHGKDKGFDTLQSVAENLLKRTSRFMVFCVGGFSKEDLTHPDLLPHFCFSPFSPSSFFDTFYDQIDFFISPNRPFVSSPGAFDGFPLGTAVEAGIREIPLFLTDHLNENDFLVPSVDFVDITQMAPDEIAETMVGLHKNYDKRLAIGRAGAEKLKKHYSYEEQITPRIELMKRFVG